MKIIPAFFIPVFIMLFLGAGATGAGLNAQDLTEVEAMVDRYVRDLDARKPLKEVRPYFIGEGDFDSMLRAIKGSAEYKKNKRSPFTDPRRIGTFRRRFNNSVRRLRNTYVNLTRTLSEKGAQVDLLYIRRINMEEQFGMRRYVIRVRVRVDRNNKPLDRTRRIEVLYFEGKLKIMRIFRRL